MRAKFSFGSVRSHGCVIRCKRSDRSLFFHLPDRTSPVKFTAIPRYLLDLAPGSRLYRETVAKTLILKTEKITLSQLESFLLKSAHTLIPDAYLVEGVEKLWNKYAVSSRQLETEREATLGQLNAFLEGLGYFG